MEQQDKLKSLDRCDPATLDPRGRCVDWGLMRHRMPDPVGPDRAVAPHWHGTPQAESDLAHKLRPGEQAAFIKGYEALMNQLSADEAVIFADAAN